MVINAKFSLIITEIINIQSYVLLLHYYIKYIILLIIKNFNGLCFSWDFAEPFGWQLLNWTFTISVLADSGVLDKGNITSIFNQTPVKPKTSVNQNIENNPFICFRSASILYEKTKNTTPECAIVCVILLLIAWIALKLSSSVSHTLLTQRRRVIFSPGNTTGVKEVSNS